MEINDKRYIIGIDLGTTNSAVSYVDLGAEERDSARIRLFQIPQLTGAGEFSRLPVLPSFIYIPGEYDISKTAITIPWKTEDDNFVGSFARDHGAMVPARLVSSAKSWLCHDKADRHARILPWGAGDEVIRVSPVAATAYFLRHIRNAWNDDKGDDVELYLENQIVTITVPASFDEVARDMTLEAAAMAGFGPVTLLEEPLAAFYSWLIQHEKTWSDHVRPGELILVCDVGGGDDRLYPHHPERSGRQSTVREDRRGGPPDTGRRQHRSRPCAARGGVSAQEEDQGRPHGRPLENALPSVPAGQGDAPGRPRRIP